MLSHEGLWARLIRELLRRRRMVLIIVLASGVLLSMAEFSHEWSKARLDVEEAFRSDAAEHFGTLQDKIQDAVDSAASVADFIRTVESVDRRRFRAFVAPHLTRAPGLISLVWAPRVPNRNRARFEAAGRREWGPDFQIFDRGAQDRPAGQRAEYFPVYYRETNIDLDNSRVVGQDWGSTPARLEALQRARDTGRPAMTGKVRLTRGVAGVHVYWPIYRSGSPPSTVEQRREHLRGFVGAIFEIEQLMKSSLGQLTPQGIDITVFDEGAPEGERVLFQRVSRPEDPPRSWLWHRLVGDRIRSRLDWSRPLEVSGRRWEVSLTPTAGYVNARIGSEIWDDLLIGLVITSFVGGYLLLLLRRTDEVERLVDSRTLELTQARDQLLVEVAERTRAETGARAHAAQLDAVRRLSTEVVREVDIREVLALVARQAGDLLHTGTSTVWLWDEGEQVLVPGARHGPGEWHREARLRLGEGVVGAVAARRQGLVVNDYRTSPSAVPFFLERTQTTAVVAEPLLYRDQLLGVLGVDNEATGRPFTDEDRQILALFAVQAAIAIHTAQLFDEVAAGREQTRRLTQQIISVQEEERRRLSRELFDEVGQTLTALVLNLRLLHAELPKDQGSLRHRLYEVGTQAREVVEQIRLLAQDLRPPLLDTLGLNQSLEDLCDRIAHQTGLAIMYSGADVSSLPDTGATCLYQVLQEALSNVTKHARATQVRVTLRHDAARVILTVEDDGQGFDAWGLRSSRHRPRSLGLPGIQERLELLGGRLQIVSRPGQGTRLIAEVHAAGIEAANPVRP
ncbi:MAG TPA: CHASE domain-containing protein [Candidatus Methylomirabilis sp.]|nr:CHASE domain-containing protein [Candidatus Methylomirabilis sp.]HSC71512.1 CHASE domain-containing protein [Candidatus Methylomirabilis sp.]